MSTFAEASELLRMFQNLAFPGSLHISCDLDLEPCTSDRGAQEYQIVVGGAKNVVGVAGCLAALDNCASAQEKVKMLAGWMGVGSSEVDQIMSNFPPVKTLYRKLFEQWLEDGRPGTHIYR